VVGRPWVAAVHVWISRPDGTRACRDRMKLMALRRARVIAVSSILAKSLPFRSTVVPDPYDADIFQPSSGARDADVLFVGRLVSDKGADLLIRAISVLNENGRRVRAKIIGDGPERASLQELAEALRLGDQIIFCGSLSHDKLAGELARSKVLAVPSRWSEPFGIVALEGLACGCAVVASDGGGLEEALGGCGILFRRGDVIDLARQLSRALDGQFPAPDSQAMRDHLDRHSPQRIAAEYLRIFDETLRGAQA